MVLSRIHIPDSGVNKTMNVNRENQALLIKNIASRHENNDRSSTSEDSCRYDEWNGDTDSCCRSDCTDTSSEMSDAEWELWVNAKGELFYIKSNILFVSNKNMALESNVPETSDLTGRKQISGKLARLIKRRNSNRQCFKNINMRNDTCTNTVFHMEPSRTANISKVTFQDWQEGEIREVTMSVGPHNQHNLGRRATLCETILGLIVSTFSDNSRVMVAGFIPDGEAVRYKSIKIGDWLRCVNEKEVTIENIDSILDSIVSPCKIKLKLQRVAGCDVTAQLPPVNQQKVYQSELASILVGSSQVLDEQAFLQDVPFGVLYLTLDGLVEGGPSDQGIIYSYPNSADNNLLATVRGCFTTLQHVLSDITMSHPVCSTVMLSDHLLHVLFRTEGRELLLIAISGSRCTIQEALDLSSDITQYLLFVYQTLSRCFGFSENYTALDHLFSLFFSHTMGKNKMWNYSYSDVSGESATIPMWKNILPAAHWMPLPKEAQVQLDEILSELESNNLGDMSDDYGCQRMFSVIGSCFYSQGYLLASHLARVDLLDVHSFCRQRGLLLLTRTEPVISLVLWQEVFPASCSRGLLVDTDILGSYQPPKGRWFVLIVGEGHDLLVLLLEAGGCTVSAEGSTRPDILYIEHAQETLSYIQKVNIPAIANKWLVLNVRPQVTKFPTNSNAKTSPKRLGFSWPSDSAISNKFILPSGGSGSSGSSVNKKPQEVTSILKHRGSPDRCVNSGHGSISEDSASQSASIQSEYSDEAAPILGRRAEQERRSDNSTSLSRITDSYSDHSYDSDSDWESCRDHVQQGNSFDFSDMKQNLLRNVDDILPARLTAGEQNLLFHYIHLDVTEGVLLSPPVTNGTSKQFFEILSKFRQSSYFIRSLLHNTVHFKKRADYESSLFINKSLVAIKEHGILFECSSTEDESSRKNSVGSLCFWVVGRFFFTPHPREVYVCYQDTAPQNMVEIAFRLGMSAYG